MNDIVMAIDEIAFQLGNDFTNGTRNSTFTFSGSSMGEHCICSN